MAIKSADVVELQSQLFKNMSSMLQDSEGKDNEEISPVYFVELSKSGRAECKKCDCKIENKSLRVGVMIDGEWGLLTRWQHLDCTVFPKSLPSVNSIDGFQELSAENKALVTERFMASANEVDDDTVPVNPDELVRKAWDKPLEPSLDLLMPLLPYQKEGLGWMVNQEHNDVHGGILADEMGMGKLQSGVANANYYCHDMTRYVMCYKLPAVLELLTLHCLSDKLFQARPSKRSP